MSSQLSGVNAGQSALRISVPN